MINLRGISKQHRLHKSFSISFATAENLLRGETRSTSMLKHKLTWHSWLPKNCKTAAVLSRTVPRCSLIIETDKPIDATRAVRSQIHLSSNLQRTWRRNQWIFAPNLRKSISRAVVFNLESNGWVSSKFFLGWKSPRTARIFSEKIEILWWTSRLSFVSSISSFTHTRRN